MDADTFLLNPISELFDTSYSLIYTTDPNMATYKQERSEPAQGDKQTPILPNPITHTIRLCSTRTVTLP